MKKVFFALTVFLVFFSQTGYCSEDLIYLKSGQIIEAIIIEETDEYIQIDFDGLVATHYWENIDRIERRTESDPSGPRAFYLGTHEVGENSIEFRIPPEINTLYLFTLGGEWEGPRPDEAVLSVKLYDRDQDLITSSESTKIGRDRMSFGSMAFKEVTEENVGDIAYFSVEVKEYREEQPFEEYASSDGKFMEIYKEYLHAIEQEDLEALAKYMLEEHIEELKDIVDGDIQQFFEMVRSVSPEGLEETNEGIKGKSGFLSGIGECPFTGDEGEVNITFEKIDGSWKIDEVHVKTEKHYEF